MLPLICVWGWGSHYFTTKCCCLTLSSDLALWIAWYLKLLCKETYNTLITHIQSYIVDKNVELVAPVLCNWTLSTEVRSLLRGTTTAWGECPCSLTMRVVLASGQRPGTRKCPLWSLTVSSFPERRITAPAAASPPAPRTEPSTRWSSHIQASQSAFTRPITHFSLHSAKRFRVYLHIVYIYVYLSDIVQLTCFGACGSMALLSLHFWSNTRYRGALTFSVPELHPNLPTDSRTFTPIWPRTPGALYI